MPSMNNWNNSHYDIHLARQKHIQQTIERDQLAENAREKQTNSVTTEALASLGRRLEQWGVRLQQTAEETNSAA